MPLGSPPHTRVLPRRLVGVATCLALVACSCKQPEPRPEATRGVPVHSEILSRGDLAATLTLLGTVRPSETLPLIAVRGGSIKYSQRFQTGLRTGARVSTGELLAVIENEEARSALDDATLDNEHAQAELHRKVKAHELGVLSEVEVERARHVATMAAARLASARRSFDPLRLVARQSGTLIVTSPLADGTQVSSGTMLAEIAADGPLTIECLAAAADGVRLQPGLVVRLRHPSSIESPSSGIIREVARVVDEAGTVRVVADVVDDRGMPTPGEGVDVSVELPPLTDVLTIPDTALALGSSGSAVFVLEPTSRGPDIYIARRVFIELGLRSADRVQIVRGLDEGSRVVTTGVTFLEDGTLTQDTSKSARQ